MLLTLHGPLQQRRILEHIKRERIQKPSGCGGGSTYDGPTAFCETNAVVVTAVVVVVFDEMIVSLTTTTTCAAVTGTGIVTLTVATTVVLSTDCTLVVKYKMLSTMKTR